MSTQTTNKMKNGILTVPFKVTEQKGIPEKHKTPNQFNFWGYNNQDVKSFNNKPIDFQNKAHIDTNPY